jgi:3-dehydroquinate synthase
MANLWGASRVAVPSPTDSAPRPSALPLLDPLLPIEQRVEVTFQYRVLFTEHVFAVDNPLLAETLESSYAARPAKFLCVVEDGVLRNRPGLLAAINTYARRFSEHITLVEAPLIVHGGEQIKNLPNIVSDIHAAIDRGGICRHSYVVAVGGGALLDAVGFASATAHRGVRLVRVPTTVLSQCDSGVGVKNGINAFGKKNFIGAFSPPAAVINDSAFLETLPDREWRSGVAEAIKVALLKDETAFEEIEYLAPRLAQRDLAAMRRVIYRSAKLHLNHIANSGDPFEFGSSRPLDMGHWAAHKLEALSNYRLLHGEAVAIGLALDATYAREIGLLPTNLWRRIMAILTAVGLPTFAPELADHLDTEDHPRSVLRGLTEFREHLGGQLTIMLPLAIGRGLEVHEVDATIVRKCVALLQPDRDTEFC